MKFVFVTCVFGETVLVMCVLKLHLKCLCVETVFNCVLKLYLECVCVRVEIVLKLF